MVNCSPRHSLLWLGIFFLVLVSPGNSVPRANSPPDHYSVDGFTNPYSKNRERRFFRALGSWLFSDEWKRLDPENDHVPITEPRLTSGPGKNATVTWVGHSTVLIQHQGINVLTDPMFSKRASPFPFVGPKRFTAPALSIADLPEIHVVVISHNHYDHLDTQSIKKLGNKPLYFVPLGLKTWFINKGIAPERVVEMDWWDEQQQSIDKNMLTVTATPSQHFSGRGLTDRNETLWAAWSIAWDDFRVWFAGDTGYNDVQFKEIGARLGEVNLAIIPIGAYEPADMMAVVHVHPAEAIKIHHDIAAQRSMAIHWGTFVLSAEGVMTPLAELELAREEAGISDREFAAFAIGETRKYKAGGSSNFIEPLVRAGMLNKLTAAEKEHSAR